MSDLKIRDSANKAIKRYLKASEDTVLGINTEEVKTYMQLLDEQWDRFCRAQEAVEVSCGDEFLAIEETLRTQTEIWYVTASANFKRQIAPTTPQPSIQAVSQPVAIQLPKIDIPKFAGVATEWAGFRDIFSSLVHSNNALSNSQKLHYLRSCLDGEALRLISSFEISNANYPEAWNLLHERYQVIRIIIDQHLSAIRDVKKATEDSTKAIRAVFDSILQHVHSLKALGRPVEFWDDWLVHTTVEKLSYDTRKQWELSLEGPDMPSFAALQQFLEIRCRSLEVMTRPNEHSRKTARALHAVDGEEQTNIGIRASNSTRCLSCGSDHKIYVCKQFNDLPILDRIALIKEKKACFNCLSAGHIQSNCRSETSCRLCNARHHTMLHKNNTPGDEQRIEPSPPPPTPSSHHAASAKPILLATAKVRVQDYLGNWQTARILFDNGSQASLVTEACVLRLGLSTKRSEVVITGIGNAVGGTTQGYATLTLSPRQGTEKFTINALVLPKLTNNIPALTIMEHSWAHTMALELADPDYFKAAPIDILIGMDEMAQFLRPELRKGQLGTPMAQLTSFGWVLSGPAGAAHENQVTVLACHTNAQLTKTVARLWEIEQLPRKKFFSLEEAACEQIFATTHRRTEEGRFIVQLPFKQNIPLGESREAAERSFLRIEKRLAVDKERKRQYAEFINELIELEHMELTNTDPEKAYYMPHHAVIKDTSTTTKLRVVFNASMKSTSGYSLNDALMVGPQLQQDLFTILIRFRAHKFAMTADIEKMYRQVLVEESHTDFQRILWRDSPSKELQTFRLKRVTYGVTSASYLAVKSMHELANEHLETRANAADTILHDFYMDDLLTGSDSESELLMLQRDVSTVLSRGGFQLRKWASNCQSLLERLPSESKGIPYYLTDADQVRTLGLLWKTKLDALAFSVELDACPLHLTKRQFLADASRFFDPIGFLAPCTIKARILFQELWSADLNWDDLISDQVAEQWRRHRSDLLNLSQRNIQRWIGFDKYSRAGEIHVFSDASEKAYAAAIYARVITKDEVRVSLIAAKSRVAPLKTLSLPRLELCAAHLASKLYTQVAEALKGWSFEQFAWTDSTVTLAWIQSQPSRWSTFIANRVAAIQDVLPAERWGHVSSEDNPADCASRGVSPTWLLDFSCWWNGPEFLRESRCEWTRAEGKRHTTELERRRQPLETLSTEAEPVWHLMTKFSNYGKLKRVTAYVLRFIENARKSRASRNSKAIDHLSCAELHSAEISLIKYTQRAYFSKEISSCKQNNPISAKSTLRRLRPFLDEFGMLRAGGRLRNCNIPYDARFPLILPKSAALASLLIAEVHLVGSHAGPQLMHTILQRRFWITGARSLIRKIYRNCLKCRALNHTPMQQQMGDLPACRLALVRCFHSSAVDFAGPVKVKFSSGRGAKVTKGYICSFICMATGAMHLELAGDLSTATFLNAFKRFINRRGLCSHVYSDNGTNFVGAEKELRSMFDRAMKDEVNARFFAGTGVTWHFNPPNAPHMGGYWEIGIKRVKYHLKRILTDNLLTFEEFSTVLTEIESCVNSRPLCVHTPDAGDAEVLTPGHFIIGEPLKTLPEPEAGTFKGNLNERWQLISALRRNFWKRWKNEYITSLRHRVKWHRATPNLKVDDVVAVIGERTAPTVWRLGIVNRCIPGADGLVRVAAIRTTDGEIVRPIHKLCLLPTSNDIFTA